MAKRKRSSVSRSQVALSDNTSANNNRFITIGVGLLALGLLVFGVYQFLGDGSQESSATAAPVAVDNGALELTSIETGLAQGAAVVAEPASDRMTQYLGPPTDAASLALAEAGQLGQPTLVFFHADW